MQSKQVDNALKNFACHQERRAVVLKGDWGVGKTYLWNRILEAHKNDIPIKRYSYVSLFGLGSLKDLKRSIFENSIDTETVGKKIDHKNTVTENIKSISGIISSKFRKITKHSENLKLPGVGGLSSVVESIQFSMIKDTLICIDDFERRGLSLSARDTLGLISHLVESKNCSVILILNENSLKKDDEFFAFSEKVFDYEIAYSPTPSETTKLVFDKPNYSKIHDSSIRIGINNIRLLKKAKTFYDAIYEHLAKAPDEIIESASTTIPLCVYAIYGDQKCPVDISFIESFHGLESLYFEDENEKPENKEIVKKIEFLNGCNFQQCDEFNFELIRLIKNGYPDEEALLRTINMLERSIKHRHNTQLLKEAWRQFNNNFTNNQPDLIHKFRNAIELCSDHLNIEDLNSIGWLYAGLEMSKEFQTLADQHIEKITEKRLYKDRNEIFRWPDNPYLSKKLDEYFLHLNQPSPLSEILTRYCEEEYFLPQDLKQLADTTPEEFYNVLSTLEYDYLPTLIKKLLALGTFDIQDDETKTVYRKTFLNTWKALSKIGEESALNKLRTSRFERSGLYNHLAKEIEQENSRIQGQL